MSKKTLEEVQYDENVKKFLSQKIILAHILVHTVKEFQGMNPAEVIPLIEDKPEVSTQKVFSYGMNAMDFLGENIEGANTEDASKEEGTVYYDIRFSVYLPSKEEYIKLVIDVESQNDFKPGYDLVTRGIYYGARMLSAQKGIEFVKSDYDNLKKVYSIWICIHCPKSIQNTITEFSMNQTNIVGNIDVNMRYDLLSVVLVGLSDEIAAESDEYKLHRLLETFFSGELSVPEKKKILEEYGIDYSGEIERSVSDMCNASKGVLEKGRAEGRAEGEIKTLYNRLNMSVEEIAEELDLSVTYVQKVVDSL